MVEPTKVMPRFFRSLEMASDIPLAILYLALVDGRGSPHISSPRHNPQSDSCNMFTQPLFPEKRCRFFQLKSIAVQCSHKVVVGSFPEVLRTSSEFRSARWNRHTIRL